MDSNKQIQKLISIINMLDIVTFLSKEYVAYGELEINKENIINRGIIYKLFCSNMFNLIDYVKKSQYLFEQVSDEYNLFVAQINKLYITNNEKYFEKISKELTIYELLREMRNELNHFEKDVNDEITLFEIEIKFSDVENIRLIIEDMITKKNKLIDKNRMNKKILSRPKILYETDKIENSIYSFEEKVNANVSNSDNKEMFLEAASILKSLYGPEILLGLINGDKQAEDFLNLQIEKFEIIDSKCEEEVLKNGSEQDINKYYAIKSIIENFNSNDNNFILDKYNENIEKLFKNEITNILKNYSNEISDIKKEN